MNPYIKSSRQITAMLGLAIVLGCALGGLFAYYYPIKIGFALLLSVLQTLILSVLCSSAYYVCVYAPFTEQGPLKASKTIAVSAAVAACCQTAFFVLLDTILRVTLVDTESLAQQKGVLAIIFSLSATSYTLSLFVYDALIAVHKLRQLTERESAQELWAKSAELKALRAQINPHFLFNSLNSMSALTHLNPEKARAMIIELSNFYRESLKNSDAQFIKLEQEIAVCTHFLAIESIRYGSKLQWQFHVSPEAMQCLIPPLCLQPLFENAIKHGISQLTEASRIDLTAKVNGAHLYLHMSNRVPNEQDRTATQGTSTGLKNLQERFTLLFSSSALCEWRFGDQQFHVELVLPMTTEL